MTRSDDPIPSLLAGTRCFLDDGQTGSAFRITVSGSAVTCQMSPGFYLKQAIVGLCMGFGPLVVFTITPIAEIPWVPRIIFCLISLLGWAVLAGIMFSHRKVTFDFSMDQLVLSKGAIWSTDHVISLADVRQFGVGTELGYAENNVSPPVRDVLSATMNDGRVIGLVKSIDRAVVPRLLQLISKTSRGSLDGRLSAIQIPQPAKNNYGWFPVIALFVAFISSALMLFTGITIFQSMVAQRWPSTQGVVLQSRVWRDTRPHRSSMGRTTYILSKQTYVLYRYRVNGTEYKAKTISRDSSTSLRVAIAQAHPEGSFVRVFYNPSNPTDAVLDTSITSETIVCFLFAALLVAGYTFYVVRLNKLPRAAHV